MPKLIEYMSVGFDISYGDADYSVACKASDLGPKEVQELRAIIPVAVATLEKYLQEAMAKHQEQGKQADQRPDGGIGVARDGLDV